MTSTDDGYPKIKFCKGVNTRGGQRIQIVADVVCECLPKITHILTAELIPLPHVVTSHFPHMAVLHVAIADIPGADLLGELEACVKFIR